MQGVCTDWERLHWGMSALRDIVKGRFPELRAWELSVGTLLLSAGFREARLEAQIIVLKKCESKSLKIWHFQQMICSYFWFQKWLQQRWNHDRCGWGFGVSQLHVSAVRSWLGFPQTHKTDGGKAERLQTEATACEEPRGKRCAKEIWNLHSNTCITLKHLAEGRREHAESRQKELRSRNAGSLSSGGKKRKFQIAIMRFN